jgi:hypothetical protein
MRYLCAAGRLLCLGFATSTINIDRRVRQANEPSLTSQPGAGYLVDPRMGTTRQSDQVAGAPRAGDARVAPGAPEIRGLTRSPPRSVRRPLRRARVSCTLISLCA